MRFTPAGMVMVTGVVVFISYTHFKDTVPAIAKEHLEGGVYYDTDASTADTPRLKRGA